MDKELKIIEYTEPAAFATKTQRMMAAITSTKVERMSEGANLAALVIHSDEKGTIVAPNMNSKVMTFLNYELNHNSLGSLSNRKSILKSDGENPKTIEVFSLTAEQLVYLKPLFTGRTYIVNRPQINENLEYNADGELHIVAEMALGKVHYKAGPDIIVKG